MSTRKIDTNSSDNSEYESADDDEPADNSFRSYASYVRYKKTKCYSGERHIPAGSTNSKNGGCNFELTIDQSAEAAITEINTSSCIEISTSELHTEYSTTETQENQYEYSEDPPENDDPDADTPEEPSESSPEVPENEDSGGITTEDTENVNVDEPGVETNNSKNPSESGHYDESESIISESESQETVDGRCPEEFDIVKAGELLLKLEDDDIGLTKGKMVKFATLIVVIRAAEDGRS